MIIFYDYYGCNYMTNYDKIFKEDININFFYNALEYREKILVEESINLTMQLRDNRNMSTTLELLTLLVKNY